MLSKNQLNSVAFDNIHSFGEDVPLLSVNFQDSPFNSLSVDKIYLQ